MTDELLEAQMTAANLLVDNDNLQADVVELQRRVAALNAALDALRPLVRLDVQIVNLHKREAGAVCLMHAMIERDQAVRGLPAWVELWVEE